MRSIPFLLLALSAAARAEVSCPNPLGVEQHATVPSNGWQVSYADRPSRLIGISVYDGLPASGREVRPASKRVRGGALTVKWMLHQSTRGYSLLCNYEYTTARLYIELPPGVHYCEVAYDLRVPAAGGNAVQRMFCQ